MRIAILGATSHIAKDLVLSLSTERDYVLVLYARRPELVRAWLKSCDISDRHSAADFSCFSLNENFDAIINFVGAGDPARVAAIGPSIFDVTSQYDDLALTYVHHHAACRYIFLSSGAVYGANFDRPVDEETQAMVAVNSHKPHDWYGISKLQAELRHRATPNRSIIDVRVFNYFSNTQDIAARFFITDILRAVHQGTTLICSSEYMVRDYVYSSDFCRMITAALLCPAANAALDCYSKAPIDKPTLLAAMEARFGLRYEIADVKVSVNATGSKSRYYSHNKRAADIGFRPLLTSLEGIVQGATEILRR